MIATTYGPRFRRQKSARYRRRQTVRPEILEARTLLTAIAVDDIYRLIQDQPFEVGGSGVIANDLLESGNPLSVTSNTSPTSGLLVVNPDGSFSYSPNPGFSGADSFTYTISDGLGGVDMGIVTLQVVPTVASEASITAGPRLASVDSTQGALLDGVLGGLLGTSLSLDVLDWNGLAQGGVNAANFLNLLRLEVGAATTSEALNTDVTLLQVFNAASTAATAEGSTVVADAFDNLSLDVAGLTGTIRLGDLLQIDPNDGSLADIGLNALDLVVGGVQLFNFENVVTTPSPINISGAALGLGDILGTISLSAQVVEPPVTVVGPVGTTFHTAATRLKLDLDLIDIGIDTSSLIANLLGPLQAELGPLIDIEAVASVGQLSLYVEVASGSGALTLIDAVSSAVTLQGTPGVADVFLGFMPDALFFNRSYAIDPADITPGVIGNLSIDVSTPILSLINVSAGIGASTAALGQSPLLDTLVFNGPFPETQTFGSSTTFITNLLDTLVTNLQISIEGSLGLILDGLVNSVILPSLTPVITGAVSPILERVLINLADPALETLGIGLGEMDVTVAALLPVVPPQANDDFAQTLEDQSVLISVLNNDAAAPPGSATIVSTTAPTSGTVLVNPDGTITYTPNLNFFGTDSFSYTITGPGGGTTTATVSLQILSVNDAPIANPDLYSTTEDQALTILTPGVLLNDVDPDGDPLTAVLVAGPTNGTLTLAPDGSFVYTPNLNFNGQDSFTYQAFDGTVLSELATVTINVQAVNDAPIANPDLYSTTQGQALTIVTPGVLANDVDPDGDPLTAVLVAGPTNGTLTLNPNGSFIYTPNLGFLGQDSFTYQAFDGTVLSELATVTIDVQAVNDAPIANPDFYQTTEDQALTILTPGVLANDVDPDGDPLTAVLVTGPTNGTLTLNPDGSFLYTPNLGFLGQDSFTYQAFDGTVPSTPVEVVITVAAGVLNAPPVAVADVYSTAEDQALTILTPGVLANDVDPDGDPLTAVLVAGPTNGTLTLNPDGSFVYTPNSNFNGQDSFTYQAFDGASLSSPVSVTINVQAVNDAPIANPDFYQTTEDQALTILTPGVLLNDVDPDGDPLTAVLVTGPTNGTLTLNPDGSFVYTPNLNFNGQDSFTYQAFDGASLSSPVSVTINVQAVNDAPIANPDFYQTPQDGPLTVPGPGVLVNDVDPDGNPLTAVLVAGPTNGTLTLNPDGSFLYMPNPGFVGSDSFVYQATDGFASSQPIAVTISVLALVGPSPQVLGVDRFGFHAQPTRLVVRFNVDLDPASAQNLSNYELIGAGRDGRLGTHDDIRFVLSSATYDPTTRSVTLAPTQLLALRSNYQLIVRDGVRNRGGVALDGDGDGLPGGAAVVRFNQSALVGPSIDPRVARMANRGPAAFGGPAFRNINRPLPQPRPFLGAAPMQRPALIGRPFGMPLPRFMR